MGYCKIANYLLTMLMKPLALLIGFHTCCKVCVTRRKEYYTDEILFGTVTSSNAAESQSSMIMYDRTPS